MPQSSLRNKTVHGLGWSAMDNVMKLGISFVVGIILARLLSPDEYGLIGILMIFISVFNAIVESGFTNAIIRKKEATDVDYSTVFYTNLVISILMAAVFYFCAQPIARFFKREELVPLTQVMSSVVVINALAIVQRARMTRNIDFKPQTKVTIIATITSGIAGITSAYCHLGVWALVIQQIIFNLLTTLLLWYYNRWFPKLVFSSQSFREMWSFGWKLLVSTLIDTTWKEIYQVVVGKFYSSATLGLYTRAKQFSQIFSSNLTNIIQRVSYPVLSSIQDDRTRLKTSYQRIIKTTMLPTFVLMLGMGACAKPLILSLIGEKWIDCVPFLQLICISGMLYPLHALNLNMLQVQGRSDLFLRLEIIKKVIAVGPLLLGIFVGIYWMVAGSIVTGWIAYYLNAYYSGPFLNYSIRQQLRDIMPSLLIAITMATPLFLMSFLQINCYILLALQIIIGAAIVISICEKLSREEYKEIKNIVLSIAKKIIKRHE